MLRRALLALSLAVIACGDAAPADTTPDAGSRVRNEYVSVAGEVKFHPLEAELRASDSTLGGLPSLTGLTVRVENSIDALLNKPPLASATLAEDGKFAFEKVDVVNVTLALVGSVKPASPGAEIVESGYGLHRYVPGDARPTSFTDKPVYVVSRKLVERLAGALDMDVAAFESGGAVLGRVVDKTGKAVEGAVVNVAQNDELFYLGDDLKTVPADLKATGKSGAFVLLPSPGTHEYSASLQGATFSTKLGGRRPGTVLTLLIERQ